MTIRAWKSVFTAIFSLLVLLYAVQNVGNISGGMYASFAYVMGQADHLAYPASVVPAVTSPVLVWATLLSVLLLEFICAGLIAFGALKMWQARNGPADEFADSKKQALNGLGVAVLIWFLMFGTLGGAAFQMWQTEIGGSSFNGAFQLTVYALLLFGIISTED